MSTRYKFTKRDPKNDKKDDPPLQLIDEINSQWRHNTAAQVGQGPDHCQSTKAGNDHCQRLIYAIRTSVGNIVLQHDSQRNPPFP